MKLTFLGHACFQIETGTHTLLIDPFLTGNPLAAAAADTVSADVILVTHGHSDHLGDAVDIARRTGAAVCCTVELAEQVFAPAGISTHAGNLGGRMALPFGSVKLIPAAHSSGIPGGIACGFLLEAEGKRLYHAGDTALIGDMALLRGEDLDAALLPIGDYYTMGPADALRAVQLLCPKLTVPMHYNTFPAIAQDGDAFAAAAAQAGFRAKALRPGQHLTLE